MGNDPGAKVRLTGGIKDARNASSRDNAENGATEEESAYVDRGFHARTRRSDKAGDSRSIYHEVCFHVVCRS
jgi:hypothetical protein